MKTAFRTAYGSPDVLSIKDVGIPTPASDELLIRVHAATVNRSDCHVLTGKPYIMRLLTGLRAPRFHCTGSDVAGEVTATGHNVSSFKIGDKVMGFSGGLLVISSHAQYLLLKASRARKMMLTMPANVSWQEAAACMEGAFYAACQINPLQPKPGQKALVIGATGAIGSAYLQFLKYYGVSATAVCRGKHAALVQSLGAARVIDYTKEDFTKDTDQYDFIFDAVGKSSYFKCKGLLTKKGVYTSSGGVINMLLLLTTRLTGGKKVVFSFKASFNATLHFIKTLMEAGDFKAIIDRSYPLEQIADAYRYVMTGEKIGNVIITMDD